MTSDSAINDIMLKVKPATYDAVIMGVGHREFREMGIKKVRALGKKGHVLYDIKYVFARDKVDGRL